MAAIPSPDAEPGLMNEAETCRRNVRPQIEAAGWDNPPHAVNEQVCITDGRIIVAGNRVRRREQRRPDDLLRLTRDFTLGVVEAKKLHTPDFEYTGHFFELPTGRTRRNELARPSYQAGAFVALR
jgi:hypothetical protein